MAGQDWIKISFRKLHFKRNLISETSAGDLYFIASVDGRSVGNRDVNHISPNGMLALSGFEATIDVASKDEVIVKFQVMDKRTFVSDDDLGTLTYKLKFPYSQKDFTTTNQYWVLEWNVELLVGGSFGHHRADEIFAARSGAGFLNVNTVAGTAFMTRMEINEVRPVPPDANLPARPVFPAGTSAAKLNGAGIATINPTDDINIIPNPAVIPILSDTDATASTVSKIEFTYYRPDTLAFTDDDERLTWSASPISGGASVKFLGQPKGLKVKVYGVTAGEIKLEVKLRRDVIAVYRAVVGAVKKIPCRFNILNGPGAANQPRANPQNVADHLAIANRFLRQMAIELTLDTNTSRTDGATATDIPGIFRIAVAAGITRNVPLTGFLKAVELNYRPGVMNFAYVHSDASGNLGAASDYPASNAGGSITDSGTPSSSWKVPSGVKPDADAAALTMTLLARRQRPTPANVVGMYITDGPNGDPAQIAAQQSYAGTIAHEFGHNLNLAHRVDSATSPYNDGLNHPPGENVMHWNNPTTIAQDFDIIQAKAARQSPLIPP